MHNNTKGVQTFPNIPWGVKSPLVGYHQLHHGLSTTPTEKHLFFPSSSKRRPGIKCHSWTLVTCPIPEPITIAKEIKCTDWPAWVMYPRARVGSITAKPLMVREEWSPKGKWGNCDQKGKIFPLVWRKSLWRSPHCSFPTCRGLRWAHFTPMSW